jgi:hypothetical protein
MVKDWCLSRRALLKIITGSAGAAVSLPELGGAATPPEVCPGLPISSGQVPAGAPSAASGLSDFSPKFFNSQQLQTLAAVSDLIIPDDEHSPGARAARVYEYLDTVVSESTSKTKQLWADGLAALDATTKIGYGKAFVDCTAAQQVALLDRISKNEDHPATTEEQFFVAVKRATIAGYYTCEIGIHQELEYQGNTALADFPGCQHPDHRGQ